MKALRLDGKWTRRVSCGEDDINFFVIFMKMLVRLTDVQQSHEWPKPGKVQEAVDDVK